ncbi:MAG: NAD(P)/FAD-dependent oxidoreductase [Thermoplasmatota archaeon]
MGRALEPLSIVLDLSLLYVKSDIYGRAGIEVDFDHVVVGAGVVGAATAYHLKRLSPDADILLMDREKRAGAGNTAKSAALYRNIFSSEASKVLSTSSIRYYLTLGDRVQMNPIGYLWMFSEKQWSASSDAVSSLDPEGDEVSFPDRGEISRILNIRSDGIGPFPSIDHGIWGKLCGSLSGMGLAQHYADMFREMGGEVSLGNGMEEIVLRGRGTRHATWGEKGIDHIVDSRGEEIEARDYIFAVGARSQEILGKLGIFTGVLPKKRQLFGIKVDDPYSVAGDIELEKVPALILPAGGTYVKPILNRNLMILGLAESLGQPYDMSDPTFDLEYFRKAIVPVISHYFPRLVDYELKMKWAGYYAYHWPDKNPVVEREENIFWASGTSGSGIMKADGIGRVTASKALGIDTAEMFDSSKVRVSDLSLRSRNVDKESFVI